MLLQDYAQYTAHMMIVIHVVTGLCSVHCSHDDCGNDVQAEKNRCIAGYHQMLGQASKDDFYTGIDVEEVRSICQ